MGVLMLIILIFVILLITPLLLLLFAKKHRPRRRSALLLLGTVYITCLGALIVFGLWYYYYYFRSGGLEVNNQLQQLLTLRNAEEINRISLDKRTTEFFEKLPRDAKVNTAKTSGIQGGGSTSDGFATYYFVTEIGNKPINIYMKRYEHPLIYKIIPKWILYKISVDQPGTLTKDGKVLLSK